MKLRFEKDSIRYRIRKSDLAELMQQGSVNEAVNFPGTVLIFELRISNDKSEPVAEFNGHLIVTHIPFVLAEAWSNSGQIGIYHTSSALQIAIEKDFPCKSDAPEVKQDTFTELAANHRTGDKC